MDKFDLFCQNNLKTLKRLKEAEAVIDRLKEEMSICDNIEANLRLQIAKSLDRNVSLQRNINSFRKLSAQNKYQDEMIAKQEKTINSFESMVQELRLKVEEKVSFVSREIDLMVQVRELERRLQEQDNQLNLVRIENQVALNEKNEIIRQMGERLHDATSTMEKTKLDYNMLKNEVDRVQLLHNKEIMDLEENLRSYGREMTDAQDHSNELISILKKPDDRIHSLWDKKINVTWADAARKAQTLQDNEVSSQLDSPQIEERSTIFKLKLPRKTQAPLDIHALKDDPNQPKPKRKRLYSNNSNHFVF